MTLFLLNNLLFELTTAVAVDKFVPSKNFACINCREITEPGTYELSVWAMGGGGENNIRLFAANYDGTTKQVTAKIVNEGWQKWKQYKK